MVQFFEYGPFQIELNNDEMYTRNSTDNKYVYDFEYINKVNADSLSSKYGIRVFRDGCLFKSAILIAGGGGITFAHKNSALIDGDNLITILGNSAFSLYLPDLSLNWTIECDDSVCFGLYNISDGFVVHGELSITKINQNGKIEWQFYGRDIFVSPDGVDDFIVKRDRIFVKDWDGFSYEIDFDGKLIKNDKEN